jgi:hypothetical protein
MAAFAVTLVAKVFDYFGDGIFLLVAIVCCPTLISTTANDVRQ